MTDSEFSITRNGQEAFLSRLDGGDIHRYEAEISYDQTGRILFTPSKGFPRIDLSEKANKSGLKDGSVDKTYLGDTLPGLSDKGSWQDCKRWCP